MRTKFIPFFSCFLLLLAGCGGSSNKNQALELKLVDKYHGDYEVGFPIDVENFFYYSDRSQVNIFVSYNKNGKAVNEEISGNTFFPKYNGEYIFTCSSASKVINKKIEVINSKPSLSVKEAAVFVKTGQTVLFNDVFSEIAPTYSPSTAELSVYNVQYASYTFDIANTLTAPFIDYDFNNAGFTPTKSGLYRVNIRVVNGNKKAEGVINVVSSRSMKDGNDNVYKTSEGYASNKVILSDSIKDTFVLPAASYAQASYVVLNDLFKNGDSIGIRFKGKNIPTLGLLASPSDTGSFAISSITGYILSFERRATNRYTLYLPMNGITMKDGQASRDELLGVDDLDNDKYYYLSASLNGNNPSGSRFSHSVHWSMSEIENYGTINEKYKLLKRIDASGGWNDDYNIPDGRVVLYSSEKRDIVFQIDGMPNQNEIVQFGGTKREGINQYTFENSTTTSNTTTGNKANVNGYIAFKGNYAAGDSISFTFKGYNIPGVALFCDTISGLTGGGQGMYICPGCGDRSLNKRLTFYGPYRLDSSNPEGYISYDGHTNYQNIFWNYRVYNDLDSPFGYDNLTDFGDYLYTIKIVRANLSEVIITAILYDKQNGGTYELVAQRTYYIYGYRGPTSGNIIAYPGYINMGKYTTFSSYPVNTSPLDDNDYFTYRSSYEVKDDETLVNISKPTIAINKSECLRDISFLGVKGACDVGKTLKIKFTGKNIPNVCLFADSIDGQAIGGGRGIYLCSSFLQLSDTPALGAKQNQHKIMPYGPYRWSPQNNGYDDLTGFRYNDDGNRTYGKEGFGYLECHDDVDYEYKIRIDSLKSGRIIFTLTITNLTASTSNSFDFDLDLLSHVSLNEKLALGSDLIFYGQGEDISFTYLVE